MRIRGEELMMSLVKAHPISIVQSSVGCGVRYEMINQLAGKKKNQSAIILRLLRDDNEQANRPRDLVVQSCLTNQ